MAFGKPGRPTEDRLHRQREIYEAVSPLILKNGARYLSMQAAARAACMSIGGLYHYFPTKRELVLHGLDHEAIARQCQDFHAEYGFLADSDPAAFLDAYTDFAAEALDFIRPAFHAAMELGIDTLEQALESTLTTASDEFTARFRQLLPDADEEAIRQAGRSVHRSMIAALLDKTATQEEFRQQVITLMSGFYAPEQAASPIVAA